MCKCDARRRLTLAPAALLPELGQLGSGLVEEDNDESGGRRRTSSPASPARTLLPSLFLPNMLHRYFTFLPYRYPIRIRYGDTSDTLSIRYRRSIGH
jgi:hypothetical protein